MASTYNQGYPKASRSPMDGVSSPRRSSSCSASSREFEFWMVGNNHPDTHLLAADELFSGGVILPLHLLSLSGDIPELPPAANPSPPPQGERDPIRVESPSIMSGGGGGGLSKRWKDIFMKTGEKKAAGEETKRKKGDGRGLAAHINSKSCRDSREVRGVPSGDSISNPTRYEGPPPPQRYEALNDHPQPPRRQTWKKKAVHSSASKEDLPSDVTPPPPELNINIWPFGFARSRSARNGGGSRAAAAAARKASSAPCSRSNSRGDPDGGGGAPARRWVAGAGVHGRSGVHVGRAIPVWKIGGGGGGGGIRGLNLSVNSCIGYGGRMSCRREDGDKVVAGDEPILGDGGGDGGGGVFGIKSFFSKKVC